jgi:hypothetical protein
MTARIDCKNVGKFGVAAPLPKIFATAIFGAMNTNDVTERLQDFQQKARESARNAAVATHEYVHENAWTSVAIAAVVGCVIGFFMGRSRD